MPHDAPLDDLFPKTNRTVAERLFILEVGLRELIIEQLSTTDGARWHKSLLPPDVTAKYLRGKSNEYASKWTEHIAHHPIYYIDFPDLAKILEKNWKSTFQNMFSDKGVFLSALKSLEPIRNKLAHNRKVSNYDCNIVCTVVGEFETAVGKPRLASLVASCTIAPPITEEVNQLANEVEHACETMNSIARPHDIAHWRYVKRQWWFDSAYLTATNFTSKLDLAKQQLQDYKNKVTQLEAEIAAISSQACSTSRPAQEIVEPIESFFDLYEDFVQQPRVRGMGYKLEEWLRTHDVEGAANRAITAIGTISQTTGPVNE